MCLLPLFIISLGIFSAPNFLPISWLYILTANTLISSMYIKWIIISCYLLSLYPAVNFLSLWLSGIIAFINRNGDSAYLWNIPLLIFASASCSQSYSPGFHGFLIKFMTSDILYMLMQFIIQLCRTISHAFLLSIHAIDRFYCFVLLSLRVCWSMLSYSPCASGSFVAFFVFLG